MIARSKAQAPILSIRWRPEETDIEDSYENLLNACLPKGVAPVLRYAERRILLENSEEIYAYAFNSEGTRAISSGEGQAFRLWDMRTGRCLRIFEGHTAKVWRVTWNKNQRHVLSISLDGTFKAWDVESGECLMTFEGHSTSVWRTATSQDDRYEGFGSTDSKITSASFLIGHVSSK
jgi:WD40 repeat protein